MFICRHSGMCQTFCNLLVAVIYAGTSRCSRQVAGAEQTCIGFQHLNIEHGTWQAQVNCQCVCLIGELPVFLTVVVEWACVRQCAWVRQFVLRLLSCVQFKLSFCRAVLELCILSVCPGVCQHQFNSYTAHASCNSNT